MLCLEILISDSKVKLSVRKITNDKKDVVIIFLNVIAFNADFLLHLPIKPDCRTVLTEEAPVIKEEVRLTWDKIDLKKFKKLKVADDDFISHIRLNL